MAAAMIGTERKNERVSRKRHLNEQERYNRKALMKPRHTCLLPPISKARTMKARSCGVGTWLNAAPDVFAMCHCILAYDHLSSETNIDL